VLFILLKEIIMKSDAVLQHDVMAELKWEPSVNAAHIGVEVKNGIVTLTGYVDSYSEKWAAEQAALRVYGVKALTVELEVNLPGFSKRNDLDIAISAENVLRWSTDIPEGVVKIVVENGWITLTGELEWQYQQRTALTALRHIVGVKGISNKMSIKPVLSSSPNKVEVEAALKRTSKNETHNIHVNVQGSDVTLTGTVHSWFDRDLARYCAWNTPGVHKVIDNIEVI